VRATCNELIGAYAIAIVSEGEDSRIVVSRHGSPLVLGQSDTGNYAASDTSALLQVTRNMIYLEDGDMAELTRTSMRVFRLDGTPVERPMQVSQLSADAVELGNFRHYMQKEIFEQPAALSNTLEMLAQARSITPNLFGADDAIRSSARCGACWCWPAVPAITPVWSRATGWKTWPASNAALKSPANTATASRWPTRIRWSSPFRSRAKPPTRWLR
jgi:glucosamine 6-phosphate synthetase-like amidotransferase/phosphosugar isomerase protein